MLASSVEQQNAQCEKLSAALAECETTLQTATAAEEQVVAMQAQMDAIAQAAADAL